MLLLIRYRLRLRLHPPLQQADPSRILRQAIASGQTVAEHHNRSGGAVLDAGAGAAPS